MFVSRRLRGLRREGMQQAVLFRREIQFVVSVVIVVIVVIVALGFVCVNQRDLREILGVLL